MNGETILQNVERVSTHFAQNRGERQLRRELVPSDFEQLKDAGFLLTGVPVEKGGIWEDTRRSARPICEILRTLAHGDSSVALVAAMHPAVLVFWLATPQVPSPFQEAWQKQRNWIFETALNGAQWGTITSEPGSGGDLARTKTMARPASTEHAYQITGQKHFGSGSGITSYMITTALVEGTKTPDLFFMDMQNVPWDGSTGATLTAPWNGHGMIATQSHGMKFNDFPATRCAWPDSIVQLAEVTNPFIACLFSAVIVGIVEVALETARQRLGNRPPGSFQAYEQVEWSKAEMEGWLIQQAYEGMLRAVEGDKDSLHVSIQGEMAIAELAESVTRRICRVMGGGTFSRHTPFGFWFEDVRALGFLRPPWALAYSNLFEWSMAD
jgi:alkylation response protein AidB-like acyl-CoA dehydrogenase